MFYIIAIILISINPIFCSTFAQSALLAALIEIKQENLPSLAEFKERIASKAEEKTVSLFIQSDQRYSLTEKEVKLNIVLDSEKGFINATSVIISYPKDILNLVAIDTTESDFSIFLEKEIDQKHGTAIITCLQPFPGIIGKANIVNLVFQPLKKGDAWVKISEDSMVLANDGYGTDVLNEVSGTQFLIGN